MPREIVASLRKQRVYPSEEHFLPKKSSKTLENRDWKDVKVGKEEGSFLGAGNQHGG